MKLPRLYSPSSSKIKESIAQEFRGYNHNNVVNTNEFYDMQNMTADNYPYASPRKYRGAYVDGKGKPFGSYTFANGAEVKCSGIATKQGYCFVEGNRFYYKPAKDAGNFSSDTFYDIGQVTPGEKQFVSMGAYICIFPDKKIFWSTMFLHYDDEEWLKERGITKEPYFSNLGAKTTSKKLIMNMCDVYGTDFKVDYVGAEKPSLKEGESYKDGYTWLKISDEYAQLFQYSSAYLGWVEITSTYIKIKEEAGKSNFKSNFKQWDGITISGMPAELDSFNSATILYIVGEENKQNYIVVPGILDTKAASKSDRITLNDDNSITISMLETDAPITFERKVPDMDYVCEMDNRLWGCSNENHEIYASKIGDAKNFNSFTGDASSSYVATIGSDGNFTGCIGHLGYILFFKENRIHKIYGTKPSNFQITELEVRGVQEGCNKSLCVVDETLFYKSKTGIMMYQGSLPELISNALGEELYSNAVAGACEGKLYMTMKNSKGKSCLFVYNCGYGFIHKEDETEFKEVISTLDDLIYLDNNNELKSIRGRGNSFKVRRLVDNENYVETEYHVEMENAFDWYIETGDLYLSSIDNKFITKLKVLLDLKKDTKLSIYLKYDNDAHWRHISTKTYRYAEGVKNTFNIPIMVKRSRRLKMRIEGQGDCLIQAISLTFEQGSEL